MKTLFAFVVAIVAAGVTLEAGPDSMPAPEPLTCYGVAPYCGYPLVQCCLDSTWSCCRKSY